MSVANFGLQFSPFSTTDVPSLLVADIVVPIVGDGAAPTSTVIVRTAANAALNLVVGPGSYYVKCSSRMRPAAAGHIDYAQIQLNNLTTGSMQAASGFISGTYTNVANLDYRFEIDTVVFCDVATTFQLVYFATGQSAACAVDSQLTRMYATRISS